MERTDCLFGPGYGIKFSRVVSVYRSIYQSSWRGSNAITAVAVSPRVDGLARETLMEI